MAKGQAGNSRNADAGNGGDFVIPPAENSGSNGSENIGGVEVVDAAKLANENGGTGGRKERSDKGKPRGSRSGTGYSTNKEGATISVEGLEALLLSVHAGLAIRLSSPEIALTDAEAHRMAILWKEVEKNYPKTRLPAEVVCLVNMAAYAAYIYGSRIVAIRIRLAKGGKAEPVYSPPPPPQASAANPAPAAEGFDFNFAPFGEEAKPPTNMIDFPIIRK